MFFSVCTVFLTGEVFGTIMCLFYFKIILVMKKLSVPTDMISFIFK